MLRVFGSKDVDGYYRAEDRHGRRGLVPANMVAEISADEAAMQGLTLEPRPRKHWNGSDPALDYIDPRLRRMRFGELKSRSYDYAYGSDAYSQRPRRPPRRDYPPTAYYDADRMPPHR